jgi:DtxR family transcriptional regulator, Mn-dependent transcriptional regulator
MKIGVSAETAADDACKIEHVISAESFDAIKRYAETESEKEN